MFKRMKALRAQVWSAAFLASTTVLGGCDGHHNLEGSIQRYRFSYKQGSATVFHGALSPNAPAVVRYWIDLYDATYPRCGTVPSHRNVRLDGVPAAVGHYPLDGDVRVVFAGLDVITVRKGGTIDVTEVSSTTIAGSVHVIADVDEWVEGDFRSDICPDPLARDASRGED